MAQIMNKLTQKIRSAYEQIKKRPFDRLPLHGVGAEIGVYRGIHARKFLNRIAVQKLYVVDPWINYTQMFDLPQAERICHFLLDGFEDRCVFCKATAQTANLPQLDFAYIDALHTDEGVTADMETIWPLIKPGGIMGGHDFDTNWPGVVQGVIRFVAKNNLTLNVQSPDWWVVKSHNDPN
jgi:hypothetical protein